MFGQSSTERDAEFTQFARTASPTLQRTAYLLTGDRELAAELVQETLLRTYLAWRRVRREEAVAYARRTLVNLNIDRWRRCPPVTVSEVDTIHTGDENRADDRDELVRVLAQLPPQQRRVIVLRYYNDLSEAETAAHLGVSVGAVKSAASRGLATLRAVYTPVMGGEL